MSSKYIKQMSRLFGHYQVHQPPKCYCGPSESKRHHFELEGTLAGNEGCLLRAGPVHLHLMIDGPQVEHRTPTCSRHHVQAGVEARFLPLASSQSAIICAETQCAILLHQDDIGRPLTDRWFDKILTQHSVSPVGAADDIAGQAVRSACGLPCRRYVLLYLYSPM